MSLFPEPPRGGILKQNQEVTTEQVSSPPSDLVISPNSNKKVTFDSNPHSISSSTLSGNESPTHPFSDSDSDVETYRAKAILRGEMKGPVYVYGATEDDLLDDKIVIDDPKPKQRLVKDLQVSVAKPSSDVKPVNTCTQSSVQRTGMVSLSVTSSAVAKPSITNEEQTFQSSSALGLALSKANLVIGLAERKNTGEEFNPGGAYIVIGPRDKAKGLQCPTISNMSFGTTVSRMSEIAKMGSSSDNRTLTTPNVSSSALTYGQPADNVSSSGTLSGTGINLTVIDSSTSSITPNMAKLITAQVYSGTSETSVSTLSSTTPYPLPSHATSSLISSSADTASIAKPPISLPWPPNQSVSPVTASSVPSLPLTASSSAHPSSSLAQSVAPSMPVIMSQIPPPKRPYPQSSCLEPDSKLPLEPLPKRPHSSGDVSEPESKSNLGIIVKHEKETELPIIGSTSATVGLESTIASDMTHGVVSGKIENTTRAEGNCLVKTEDQGVSNDLNIQIKKERESINKSICDKDVSELEHNDLPCPSKGLKVNIPLELLSSTSKSEQFASLSSESAEIGEIKKTVNDSNMDKINLLPASSTSDDIVTLDAGSAWQVAYNSGKGILDLFVFLVLLRSGATVYHEMLHFAHFKNFYSI